MHVASTESLSSTAYLERRTFSIKAVVLDIQRTRMGDLGFFSAFILWASVMLVLIQ